MKINNEIKIGFMVSVAIVLLVSLTFKVGNFNFSKDGYMVKVQFKDINGVNLSSPVMFNGYKMGHVENIVIKDDTDDIKMELILWLDNKARLRQGAKAYVKNLGLMGEKYIGLTSGNKDAAYLPLGVVIIGEQPPDFENLMSNGEEIAEQLKEISRSINEGLERNKETVDEILLGMNVALKNIIILSNSFNKRLEVNKDDIDSIVINLEATSRNLEEMSLDLKKNPWKIMYKGKGK